MSKNMLHSRYWLGSHADDDSIDLASKGTTSSEIIKLANIKNAIANFVRIVTKRSIPVRFNNGKDSYTDGDQVIVSASTKEKTFDAVVGLALHEATHCVWREFPDFLKQFGTYNNHMIPQWLKDKCEDVNITTESRGKLLVSHLAMMLKHLMNVFEDRRIDWWLYRTAPGYRPYYEALYGQYWHSRQIDYALQQGKWTTPTVDSYINMLINMTNPWFDTRTLPDLDLMYGMIDVDNINRFDGDKGYKYVDQQVKLNTTQYDEKQMPGIFQLALQVMSVVLDNCLPLPDPAQMPQMPKLPFDDFKPEKDETMEDNLDLNQSVCSGEGQGVSMPGGESDDDSEEEESDDNESGGGGSSTDDSEEEDGSGDDSDGAGSGDEDSEEEDLDGGSGASDDSEESEDGDSEEKDGTDGDGDESDEDSDGESSEGEDSDTDESEDDGRKEKHAEEVPKKTGKVNDKKLDKALEKQKDFLNGDVQKKKVTKKVDDQVKAIEQSGASEVEVSHDGGYGTRKARVLVLRKLTREILESGAFPFTPGMRMEYARGRRDWVLKTPHSNWKPSKDHWSEKAVEDGFRMGNVLAHRLQIRNMERVTRFNRRDRGKIERRRLHSIGAGDLSVFFKDKTTKFAPVLAHMTLDASSSMHGEKWYRALAVGIAVAVAASKINNLDLVLSMRAGVGNPCMAIIYDSRVDKPMKMKQLFPYLTTVGNTPEGLCFAAIMDDLLKEKHGERYFINLSDGQPQYTGYSGAAAWKHTREQVNILRGSGLRILSYFISGGDDYRWYASDSKEGFETMYGKDASFIDVQRITSLARTLNRLFLIR